MKKKSDSALNRIGNVTGGSKKMIVTGNKVQATGKKPDTFYVVCIGASAGGFKVIEDLLSQFAEDVQAAFFVVMHFSSSALGDILLERLAKSSKLKCSVALQNAIIRPGNVYISPADIHLLVKQDRMVLGYGPPENRFRPSIDVLLRSAAAAFGPRSIGVVLTGLLYDGTAGMLAIKTSGGHCVVQDPMEAEFPDMPLSVLENVEVDHTSRINNMGAVITGITQQTEIEERTAPTLIIAESKMSEEAASDIRRVAEVGEQTVFACPDCGGGLWKIKGEKMDRYRCHTGHNYLESDLQSKQSEALENTLWVALRMMEERKLLLLKIARENKSRQMEKLGKSYATRADQLEEHIGKMKQLMFSISDRTSSPAISRPKRKQANKRRSSTAEKRHESKRA